MAIYKEPILGKMGVFSHVSKNFVFGICCDSKKECLDLLKNKIGYDSCKYRWSCRQWDEKAIKEQEKQQEEFKQHLIERKIKITEMKKDEKFIKDNLYKLSETQREKFLNKPYLPLSLYHHKDAINLFKEILAGRAYKDN